MNKLLAKLLVLSLTSLAVLSAAAANEHEHESHQGHRAVAVLASTSAKEAPQAEKIGVVFFEEKGDGVHITGYVKGLKPNSKHGFHVHQFGDVTADDGTSAGGHFNPHDDPHAAPGAEKHHVGDLGNITSDAEGVARIDMHADWLTLDDGPEAILGRALVVHAEADDLKSQPTGDAGSRIGVGIIGWANPESGFENQK